MSDFPTISPWIIGRQVTITRDGHSHTGIVETCKLWDDLGVVIALRFRGRSPNDAGKNNISFAYCDDPGCVITVHPTKPWEPDPQ